MSRAAVANATVQETNKHRLFAAIEENNVESFKKLVKEDSMCLYEKGPDGKFVFEARSPILDLVLELVNFNDMAYAFRKRDEDFKNLLDKCPFLMTLKEMRGMEHTLLHGCVFWAQHRRLYKDIGDLKKNDLCKMILERNPETLEIEDGLGRTPLFGAIETGNVELVRYLVHEKKANVNVCKKEFDDVTPLMDVFYYRKIQPDPFPYQVVHEKMIEILLEAGADREPILRANEHLKKLISDKAMKLITSFSSSS